MSALEGGIQDCIVLKIKDWCWIIYCIHHWHISIWILKKHLSLLYLYTVYVYIYRICIYLMNLKDLKETYLQKSSKRSQNNLQILKSPPKKNIYLCCLKKSCRSYFQHNSTVQTMEKSTSTATNQPRGHSDHILHEVLARKICWFLHGYLKKENTELGGWVYTPEN